MKRATSIGEHRDFGEHRGELRDQREQARTGRDRNARYGPKVPAPLLPTGQFAVIPPSITNSLPVTQAASSDAR
jgi:hypothetical protein